MNKFWALALVLTVLSEACNYTDVNLAVLGHINLSDGKASVGAQGDLCVDVSLGKSKGLPS